MEDSGDGLLLCLQRTERLFHLEKLTQQSFSADFENLIQLVDSSIERFDRCGERILFERKRPGERVGQRFDDRFKPMGKTVILFEEEISKGLMVFLQGVLETVVGSKSFYYWTIMHVTLSFFPR